MEDKIEDGMGQHRIELEERGVLAADGGVHLRGGGEAGKVGGVSKKKEKENSRKKQAEILAKKIKNLGKRLQSQEFLDTASKVDVKNLEEKIARRVNMLRKLDSKNGLEVSDVVEPSQASRADDSKSEDEDQAVAHGQSKKRKVSKSGFDNENEEGINEIADPSEAIVIDDTSRKIEKEKKEKKHKKHKKLKVDKSSQNSSQPLNSIPAFEEPEPEHSVKTDNANSKKTASRDRHTDQDISQNGATTPSPEKARQAALLDTITRSRTRSESAGDGIYEALVAGMLAQPSPPSPMSSIADYPRSLIDIGRSAIAAPTLPSSQKPIRDRAFKAQVPVPAPKVGLPTSHKESPIPPPVRNFSSTRIVPATRENGVEKTKSKKKDAGAKVVNHANTNTNPEPSAEGSQQSATLSETVIALKEAASATVIEGIFSQADPFTSTKKILPSAKTTVPTAASFPNSINTSTPDSTPTKSKSKSKSKSRRERRIEGEVEDWEKASGRVRARIDKEGSADDGEMEENIAFSSTYLQARPLGISISGTKFQVLSIVSGTEQELPISTKKDAIKICSVAKGRVKVSLGLKSFSIGESGMWRVRGGEKCTVANQLSSQGTASVHVSAIEG